MEILNPKHSFSGVRESPDGCKEEAWGETYASEYSELESRRPRRPSRDKEPK